MKSELCAIIVAHHPDERLARNVANIGPSVDRILVVDNSATGGRGEFLDRAAAQNVSFVRNQENLGLAKALNIGISRALSRGYEWISLFDQDSVAGDGYFDAIFGTRRFCERWRDVGIIAPAYIDQTTGLGQLFGGVVGKGPLRRTVFVPTSGNVVRAEVFEKVGLFEEKLFIDYIDYDFCFRCVLGGWTILQNPGAVLYHNVGRPMVRRLLWRKPMTSNHSPERMYYRTRNRIYVYSKYRREFAYWMSYDIYLFFKELLNLLACESGRKEKLAAVARGILHGMKGIYGKYGR